MTLEQALDVLWYYLRNGQPRDWADFHSALRLTIRAILLVQHLKEAIELCGDLYKTTP